MGVLNFASTVSASLPGRAMSSMLWMRSRSAVAAASVAACSIWSTSSGYALRRSSAFLMSISASSLVSAGSPAGLDFSGCPAVLPADRLSCTNLGVFAKGRFMLTLLTKRTPLRFSTTASPTLSVSSSTKPFSFAWGPVHQLVASIHPDTSSFSRPVFLAYRVTMFSRMVVMASMYCRRVSASAYPKRPIFTGWII